jgi:hypothetical protein
MSASRRIPRRKSNEKAGPDAEPLEETPEWLERVRSVVEHEAPVMRTLMMRAIRAVLEFSALSEASAIDASSAPTDLGVLIRALSSGELLQDLVRAEPLAPAFIRGIEARTRLLEDHGGSLTAEQVAANLGISRQAVEKRRRAGKLLAVTTGRHGYRYPVWQFSKSGTIPGLEDVLGVLAPHDEWMQMAFFLGEDSVLDGRTPLDSLLAGRRAEVLDAALSYGEHGAA